ncbi:MAG: hypothetical protein ACK4V4_06675 [Sphingobacteriales bacterium]|jgi:hypothetical protein
MSGFGLRNGVEGRFLNFYGEQSYLATHAKLCKYAMAFDYLDSRDHRGEMANKVEKVA